MGANIREILVLVFLLKKCEFFEKGFKVFLECVRILLEMNKFVA